MQLKLQEKRGKNVYKINDRLTITLIFQNFCPFSVPNYSSLLQRSLHVCENQKGRGDVCVCRSVCLCMQQFNSDNWFCNFVMWTCARSCWIIFSCPFSWRATQKKSLNVVNLRNVSPCLNGKGNDHYFFFHEWKVERRVNTWLCQEIKIRKVCDFYYPAVKELNFRLDHLLFVFFQLFHLHNSCGDKAARVLNWLA